MQLLYINIEERHFIHSTKYASAEKNFITNNNKNQTPEGS
jgi:hypothetical protein